MAAAPPLLLIIAFKIYISRTAERQFRYYEASPEEMEQEKMYSMSEKPTKQSEVENRFLHPALQHNKLFTVMVHKSQESLAREVLSAYPWFAGKHEGDGVKIKAVREVSLRGLLCGPVFDFDFDFDFFRKTSSTILRAMDGGRSAPSGLGCEIDRIDGYPLQIGIRFFHRAELRRSLQALPIVAAYGFSLPGACEFTIVAFG